MVGSRSAVRRIWVVDGFAGAGEYGDGRLGSPGLALAEAKHLASQGRSYKLSCYLVERDKANHAKLRVLVSRFPEVEVILPQPCDFWSQVDNVASFSGNEPVLLFVDPFGLGDLKFKPLTDLCKRLKQVDLMVNLASPTARRLEPNNRNLVDDAVGGPGWSADNISEVFCTRLREACSFLPPATLPVQNSIGGLRYELVLAARHPAAYKLWNDEIAADDRGILDRGSEDQVEALLIDAKRLLREFAENKPGFSRDQLISVLSVKSCGEFHSRVLRRAAEELIASALPSKLNR
jgi:three-Cys-motif partner protein